MTDLLPAPARICPVAELEVERGCAALVAGHQVAVFRLAPAHQPNGAAQNEICAIDNRDPSCGVNVLARGLVGSAGDSVYVASPLHKTRFDLRTGRCLDDEDLSVRVWGTEVVSGWLQITG